MLEEARSVLEKVNLEEHKKRNQEINNELSALTDYNSDAYIEKIRELNTSSRTIELAEGLTNKLGEYDDNQSLLNDPEFSAFAAEEIKKIEKEIQTISIELKKLTNPPLPNDEKKAIFEIRPGVGGIEAALFAEDLYKMYISYCNIKSYRTELYTLDYNEEGGIKEVVFLVDKPGSYGDLRFESGVNRVQRVPKTEALGRIHTSTASVVVLPEFDSKSINIDPGDIRVDVYRSSGPGGQSVNTTDSAVRITHLPTKIIVTSQNSKSQHKNKEMAMSVLVSKLQKLEEDKYNQEENALRQSAMQDSDRSSKIRTFNFPQSRVTDHRIGKSWFNIEEIVNGEIEEVVGTVSNSLRNQE